jgi:hypothetical protein
MARKRMIDPSLWTDEGMAELTPRQQLLYIGLFSNADDDGRLKGESAAIALMLPTIYSTNDRRAIDEDLTSVLAAMTRLCSYTFNGRRYLVFTNYQQWQRIDRPTASILPAPGTNAAQFDEDSTRTRRGLDPSIEEVKLVEEKLEENRVEENSLAPNGAKPHNSEINYSSEFLTFWKQYPTGHGSKKVAFEVWQRLRPDDELQLDIMASLAKWNASEQWQQGYIKDAERFLRNRMWEVDPPPPKPLAPARNKAQEQVDMLKRIAMEAQP